MRIIYSYQINIQLYSLYNTTMKKHNTSWNKVAPWYNKIVGSHGHYYHEQVIFPSLKAIINPKKGQSVLDIGCGQGVYGKLLGKDINYLGFDLSPRLISLAKKSDNLPTHSYYVADATQPLPVKPASIDYAISILALQNMNDAKTAISSMAQSLRPNGTLAIVLNHPAFRIPRQSSWEIDDNSKIEYRRVNRYLTPLEIPINTHPGDKNSTVTWSYHQPISYYVEAIVDSGCVVTGFFEWTSNKISSGKAKKMEDRARNQFPLFLTLVAKKI